MSGADEGATPVEGDAARITAWALDAVRRHVRRYGYRMTQGGDTLGDFFVGMLEATQVLAPSARFDLAARLGIDADGPTPPDPTASGACAALVERFGLDRGEAALLWAAAAPHLSNEVARLYRFAWADFSRELPTPGFLIELVERPDALSAFRLDRPLVGDGLVHLGERSGWAPGPPAMHRAVSVPAGVLAFLRGEPPVVSAAAAAAVDFALDGAAEDDGGPPTLRDRLAGLLAGETPRVLLLGEPGTGRRRAWRRALFDAGLGLVTVWLDRLTDETAAGVIGEAHREAVIRRAGLLLRGDGLEADDRRLSAAARAIARSRAPVALTAEATPPTVVRIAPSIVELNAPMPGAEDQGRLWARALAGEGDPDWPRRLAGRFDTSPGAIAAAVRAARRAAAAQRRPLDFAHLADAVRRRMDHALDLVAEPIHTSLGWDDVVLPDEVLATLHEIRAQARHRAQVYDRWGFRRTMPYGRGLSCLFSGPPGTGKTMMAGILAADLDREMYRVDLSRVVSKWVGETEKNLARVFAEAEKGQVMLLFDEADSLFSTRTEVRGANDRFANMEVNYLLQRMEDFEGMTILTTNFERGLDEALKRRLRFRVHFPFPGAAERAELWQRLIPAEMPVHGEVDFARLGRRYKFSGGSIKNAVLRAAFFAAEGDGALTTALLQRAADAESREMGRL